MINPSEEVLLLEPYFMAYSNIVEYLGASEIGVKHTEDYRLDLEAIKTKLSEKTKMIVLFNPNNPSGTVYTKTELRGIADLAQDHDLLVLTDEVYKEFTWDDRKHTSIASLSGMKERTILCSSFSKTFAMTGWRLGYAIVGDELRNAMTSLNQITVSNVPVFIQDAGVKALELQDEISQRLRRVYEKRARLACNILSHSKIRFAEPDAPFYLFPQREGVDSEKIIFDLLEEGIAVAPGTSFGEYRDCFRISLTRSEDEIKTGLEKIVELIG